MIRSTKSIWVSSMVVSILYEGVLATWLADWILSPHTARDNLLAANREGISSSLGYLAIYLAGDALKFVYQGSDNDGYRAKENSGKPSF